MISFIHKGDFKKTEGLFNRILNRSYVQGLHSLGKQGVAALEFSTPKDTGKTSRSWTYEIKEEPGRVSIIWSNTNVVNYVNIAVILQYGHATKNGGWVEGRDYINPAIQPIFDSIAKYGWEEVVGK